VGKQVFYVPGGRIVIACSGDIVANESSSVDPGYYKTDLSTNLKVDVIFTKDGASSEYVYQCRAGQPLGGIVEQP
jgi:hypothetical protein